MILAEVLESLGACEEATLWLGKRRSLQKAWRECPRGDWNIWLACELELLDDLDVNAAIQSHITDSARDAVSDILGILGVPFLMDRLFRRHGLNGPGGVLDRESLTDAFRRRVPMPSPRVGSISCGGVFICCVQSLSSSVYSPDVAYAYARILRLRQELDPLLTETESLVELANYVRELTPFDDLVDMWEFRVQEYLEEP